MYFYAFGQDTESFAWWYLMEADIKVPSWPVLICISGGIKWKDHWFLKLASNGMNEAHKRAWPSIATVLMNTCLHMLINIILLFCNTRTLLHSFHFLHFSVCFPFFHIVFPRLRNTLLLGMKFQNLGIYQTISYSLPSFLLLIFIHHVAYRIRFSCALIPYLS